MCVQWVTRVPLTWNREREQNVSLTIIIIIDVSSDALQTIKNKIFSSSTIKSYLLLRLHFCFSTLRSSLVSQVVRLFFNIEKIRSSNFFSFSFSFSSDPADQSINQSVQTANAEQVFNSKQVDLFAIVLNDDRKFPSFFSTIEDKNNEVNDQSDDQMFMTVSFLLAERVMQRVSGIEP